MNKKIIIFLIAIIIIVGVISGIYYILEKNDMSVAMKAIVINVKENSLDVMEIGHGQDCLYSVSFSNEGNIGFKRGQEILVYYNGYVVATYLGIISSVGKIKIVKEESNIKIPDEILRFYESSKDNVKVELKEITNSGISLIITDTNKLPYDYTNHKYKITKKVKNENYKGEGKLTAGINTEYIWEEVEAVGSVLSVDTEQPYDLSNIEESENVKVIGRKFDWSELYGELGERRI